MIQRWCVNCLTTIKPDELWASGVLQGQFQAWHVPNCPEVDG